MGLCVRLGLLPNGKDVPWCFFSIRGFFFSFGPFSVSLALVGENMEVFIWYCFFVAAVLGFRPFFFYMRTLLFFLSLQFLLCLFYFKKSGCKRE